MGYMHEAAQNTAPTTSAENIVAFSETDNRGDFTAFDSDLNEDILDEAKPGMFSKLKTKLWEKLPKFITKKERILPEKKNLCDIEFDEIKPEECGTVLLSENNSGCSGKLLYEGGGRNGRDIDIVKTPFSIGSKIAGNDAVLSSEAVSRYHARITRKNGSYYICDLNSKNGTCINGQYLAYHEERKLCRMDTVSFADVVYRVV